MLNIEEIWVKINDGYEVSSLSRVRSIPRRVWFGINTRYVRSTILKTTLVDGYNYLVLYGKTKKLSRLVAKAFIPNPENKSQVNHINGIKNDDRIENLEWVTNQENGIHAYATGLNKPQCGSEHGRSKLTEVQVRVIRETFHSGMGTRQIISEYFNVHKVTIQDIINRKTWNHI